MDEQKICERCGGVMKRYDRVKRVIRVGDAGKKTIFIERYRCAECGHIRRILPDGVIRFKQYAEDVIQGVRDGLITSETIGYEDFPCEETMKRWKKT